MRDIYPLMNFLLIGISVGDFRQSEFRPRLAALFDVIKSLYDYIVRHIYAFMNFLLIGISVGDFRQSEFRRRLAALIDAIKSSYDNTVRDIYAFMNFLLIGISDGNFTGRGKGPGDCAVRVKVGICEVTEGEISGGEVIRGRCDGDVGT